MKSFSGIASILAIIGMTLSGCQTGGGSRASGTPLSMAELYNYFAEQTQVREGGGVYYSGFGTMVWLKDGERSEGTWASYDGGKLCRMVDEKQVGPCEIYYRSGDDVSIEIEDKVSMAPKMMKGNQLDLIETGSARKMYTPEQTTALVSGKTAVWEDGNGAYYAPDGSLMTLWDGVKEGGKWTVDEKGGICWHVPSWGKSPCEYYFDGPDGLMAVYKGEESPAVEHRDGDQLDNL